MPKPLISKVKAKVKARNTGDNGPRKRAKAEKTPSAAGGNERDGEMPREILVVAGTYERLLYGLTGKWAESDNDNAKIDLEPVFIMPAHTGCVKTLSIGGRYLATGSTDETIKLFDVKKLRELGSLHHHSGTITQVLFHGQSHLLTTSEDGTICIFRSKDWEMLQKLKGHKAAVNSFAVHPSGKLAISVAKDRTAVVWNLMTGKKASKTKLAQQGEVICWNKSGTRYAVVSGNMVTIYNIKDASVHSEVRHTHSITSVEYLEQQQGQELLVLGSQSKQLFVYQIPETNAEVVGSGKLVLTWESHDNRIKGLSVVEVKRPDDSEVRILTSISSDGKIKLWDLGAALAMIPQQDGQPESPVAATTSAVAMAPEDVQAILLGSYNADCRLTCVATSPNVIDSK
ncbi:60s ribosome biogenesis protein mak11 [Spiromyces aspiralis]|uniref:60s ribosome biogenesis protein mak11 n=1 Tax=Spiromyces aspiralis TaxID=68401 RepID=A0ACC1HU29_9FUNG|nr:60s ribosome biogenesis protein mak11 [Spiromyces aspiralis]